MYQYSLLNTIYCNINLLNVYVCIYITISLLLLYSIYIIKHIYVCIYVSINHILPLEILPLVIESTPPIYLVLYPIYINH